MFGDGERYKYVQITILDDDVPEGNEHFQMIIASPSFGLELGEKTTGTKLHLCLYISSHNDADLMALFI